MKKAILLFIASFITLIVFAQNTYFKWAKQMAGGDDATFQTGWDMEVDASGYVYTTGHFTGTVDFDPGPGVYNLTAAGQTDVFISKLDANGNFVWAKRIGGVWWDFTRSVTLDAAGNIIIVGWFSQTADFDPGPGTFNLTANADYDAFILKLSSAGDLIWVKQIRQLAVGSFLAVYALSSATDAAGNIYLTGQFNGTADFDPGPGSFIMTSLGGVFTNTYVVKLDAGGNFVWAKAFTGNRGVAAYGLNMDVAGNIYLAGSYTLTADFDPGPGVYNLTSNGGQDIFAIKLNNNGDLIWARSMGGSTDDHIYKAVPDQNGNVYLTGFYTGTADLDPGPGVYNLSAAGDAILIMKLDVNGNFVWAKGMAGPSYNNWGFGLVLDNAGNVYTVGDFRGPVDFDPGPGVYSLNSTSLDIFISKLDNNGNFVWAKSIGPGSFSDQGYGIFIDSYKNIYTTGHFGGTVDFDPDAGVYNLTGDTWDIYIQKIAQCISSGSVITDSACNIYTLNGQTYTSSGTYIQTIANSSGCDSIITLNLTIYTKIYRTVDPAICEGQSYYAGGANQTTTGIYMDTLQTALGCDSIITTILTVHPAPKPYLGPDQQLCYGNVLTLSVPGYKNYLWDTGEQGSTISINSFGTHYLTVTDYNDCKGTDSINIQRSNCIYIGIPNAFTPNKDAKNDIFKPTINQVIRQYSFVVFNRYGQKIFETNQYGTGWDGRYKGKDQPVGTYVYRIVYTTIFGYVSENNGTVMLLR